MACSLQVYVNQHFVQSKISQWVRNDNANYSCQANKLCQTCCKICLPSRTRDLSHHWGHECQPPPWLWLKNCCDQKPTLEKCLASILSLPLWEIHFRKEIACQSALLNLSKLKQTTLFQGHREHSQPTSKELWPADMDLTPVPCLHGPQACPLCLDKRPATHTCLVFK